MEPSAPERLRRPSFASEMFLKRAGQQDDPARHATGIQRTTPLLDMGACGGTPGQASRSRVTATFVRTQAQRRSFVRAQTLSRDMGRRVSTAQGLLLARIPRVPRKSALTLSASICSHLGRRRWARSPARRMTVLAEALVTDLSPAVCWLPWTRPPMGRFRRPRQMPLTIILPLFPERHVHAQLNPFQLPRNSKCQDTLLLTPTL